MPGQADLARAWMQKGDSDRHALAHILAGPGPYDTACFHAQQAVEKYLKAVLALSGRPIARTHDLEVLHAECLTVGISLPLDPFRLATLTPYAVQLRYDAGFWPDLATAQEAARIVDDVRSAVLGVLPPEAHP